MRFAIVLLQLTTVAGDANSSRANGESSAASRSCPLHGVERGGVGGCDPDRHRIASKIVKHLHKKGLHKHVFASNVSYAAAKPFPHGYVDDLFPEDVLDALDSEFPDPDPRVSGSQGCKAASARGWRCSLAKGRGGFLKIGNKDERTMGPPLQGVMAAMKSRTFVAYLEQLTGIQPLVVDDTNEGAGQHQILRGGSLQIHADFNQIRAEAGVHRRVNVFLYLNRDWQPSWAGALELWNRGMTKCAARIAPLRNRLVVFSTTDFSYHGHADPLSCPVERSRRSIAMYYYSTAPAALADCLVDADGKPVIHSTLYKVRKCDTCLKEQCQARAGERARRLPLLGEQRLGLGRGAHQAAR